MITIALITDIHYGPSSHNKAEDFDALGAIDDFVAMAEREGADLLLDLGDRISDRSFEEDARSAAAVVDRLAAFSGPRAHLLGNHDVVNLSIADNERILGQSMQSRIIDPRSYQADPVATGRRLQRTDGLSTVGGYSPLAYRRAQRRSTTGDHCYACAYLRRVADRQLLFREPAASGDLSRPCHRARQR